MTAIRFGRCSMILSAAAWLAVAALPFCARAENAKASVEFRSEALVSGENYTLGDLASVKTDDKSLKSRLESLEMGKSPNLGYKLPLNASVLTIRLEEAGVDTKEVSLSFPKKMHVQRSSQEVNMDALREEIVRQLCAKLPFDRESLLVENVSLPRSVEVPAGELGYEVSFRLPRRGIGAAVFNADILVDGERRHTVTGTIRYDARIKVLQAASPIGKGDLIAASSLEIKPRLVSELRGNPVESKELQEPLTAIRTMMPGEVLTWSNIQRQALVRRGKSVRMILTNNAGMTISTLGVAREDGAMGDRIEALNQKSGKQVEGVVIATDTIQVPF